MARGRPVDVLFDARHIQQSGIGTYIRTQLPHLEDATARHGQTLAVLANNDSLPETRPSTIVIPASPQGAPMYSAAEQLVWHRAFRAARPRAVWLPHYPYPVARWAPYARRMLIYATVHDTIHLLPRDVSGQSWLRRAYARVMLSAVARSSRVVFTPSQATAATLKNIERSARVLVTPIPVGEIWFQPADVTLSPVTRPYLLYVGNAKRHKNLPLLVEAFLGLADAVPHTLVIAGGGASLRTLDDRVRGLAESNPERIVVTGQVDFPVLRAMVAAADALIMPSLHEGAGLPPLEAMASGTAVLASDIPAVRETCGDGAAFFDPRDRDGLTGLMRTYCCDDVARARLADRGHAHVVQRQQQIRATAAADTICAELAGRAT